MDYKVKEREVKVGEGQVVIMCHHIKFYFLCEHETSKIMMLEKTLEFIKAIILCRKAKDHDYITNNI